MKLAIGTFGKLIALLVTGGVVVGLIWFSVNRASSPSYPGTGSGFPAAPIPISLNSLVPTGTASSPSSQEPPLVPPEWKTLKVDNYKFQVSYPQGWTLAKNVTNVASNPYPIRYSVDVISARPDVNGEMLMVPLVIAVYDAPSVSMTQWLTDAYGLDVTTFKKGDIDSVLAKAYSGGTGFVYSESQNGDVEFYGIGSGGPGLTYSTYILKSSSKYVYLMQIRIPLGNSGEIGERATQPDQYDKAFVEDYKLVISSFRFTN